MNRLLQICKEMKGYNILRGQFRDLKDQLERILEKIELDLTPSEGWPGKNEGERQLAKLRTFNVNPEWIRHSDELRTANQSFASLGDLIIDLENERKAIEYSIRNETNILAGGRDWLDELSFTQQTDQELEREEERLNQVREENEGEISPQEQQIAAAEAIEPDDPTVLVQSLHAATSEEPQVIIVEVTPTELDADLLGEYDNFAKPFIGSGIDPIYEADK